MSGLVMIVVPGTGFAPLDGGQMDLTTGPSADMQFGLVDPTGDMAHTGCEMGGPLASGQLVALGR